MVDVVSQNLNIEYVHLRPDDLREMARWVLEQCITTARMGGFVTKGLGATIDYLVDPATDFQHDYRKVIISSRDCIRISTDKIFNM